MGWCLSPEQLPSPQTRPPENRVKSNPPIDIHYIFEFTLALVISVAVALAFDALVENAALQSPECWTPVLIIDDADDGDSYSRWWWHKTWEVWPWRLYKVHRPRLAHAEDLVVLGKQIHCLTTSFSYHYHDFDVDTCKYEIIHVNTY